MLRSVSFRPRRASPQIKIKTPSHFLSKLRKVNLSDPFFDLFSDVLEKPFWHYISMNYGVCINFDRLAWIWPYFGPYDYLYHKNHWLPSRCLGSLVGKALVFWSGGLGSNPAVSNNFFFIEFFYFWKHFQAIETHQFKWFTIVFTQNKLNSKISIVTKVMEHFVNSEDFGPFSTLLYDLGILKLSKEKRFNEKKVNAHSWIWTRASRSKD